MTTCAEAAAPDFNRNNISQLAQLQTHRGSLGTKTYRTHVPNYDGKTGHHSHCCGILHLFHDTEERVVPEKYGLNETFVLSANDLCG